MDENASGLARFIAAARGHPAMVVAGIVVSVVITLASFTGAVADLTARVKRPETVRVDGRWTSAELTNPFDPNTRFRVVLDLRMTGDGVGGNLTEQWLDGRTIAQRGILEGRLESRALTFHTREQSLYGSETISFSNIYRGTVYADSIRFTFESDRPWGFPTQTFLATRD